MESSEDPVSMLCLFGLTRLEAGAYLALLACGELNGYELAKESGISRSNAYTALSGLVDKGAAHVVEGAVTRYQPVAGEVFLANHLRNLEQARDRLQAMLPSPRPAASSYLTIKGRRNVMDQIRLMLSKAELRVYLAMEGGVLESFTQELLALAERGYKVVVITDLVDRPGLAKSLGHPRIKLMSARGLPGQIRVITDSRAVLTGDLGPGDDASCLYSDQKNLVDLFKQAVGNEIRLIELGIGPGEE